MAALCMARSSMCAASLSVPWAHGLRLSLSTSPSLQRTAVISCARQLSSRCWPPSAVSQQMRSPMVPVQIRSFVTALERTRVMTTPQTLALPSNIEAWSHIQKRFSTKNISGPKFWKSRRKKVPVYKFNWRSKWLEGAPSRKGICVKVLVISPKKPNSGLRKIAKVQLPNKRLVRCYIPGIGHNLQAHSVVLVKGGRTHDVSGCNYKLIRGKYDLLPVKGRMRARSRYGVKRPKTPHVTTRFKWVTTNEDRAKYEKRTGKPVEPGPDGNPGEVPRPPWPLFRKKPAPIAGFGRKKAH
eukprot:GEMP01077833.1.p1 GENE.GEMP01077833.1~~GEMP01077833.1.p1  ORF type:complete len:327 (+),score=52.44 GEMP01077833.1:91-981(+)